MISRRRLRRNMRRPAEILEVALARVASSNVRTIERVESDLVAVPAAMRPMSSRNDSTSAMRSSFSGVLISDCHGASPRASRQRLGSVSRAALARRDVSVFSFSGGDAGEAGVGIEIELSPQRS